MAMRDGRFRKASSVKKDVTGIERSGDDNWRATRTSAQCLSYLCLSEHLSDISFTFTTNKSVKLPAHKFVLSMRSAVFEAMFYGSLSEGGQTVLIEDVEPDVMKVVLRYIYSDKPQIDGNNVLRCLYTAKKYDLSGLVLHCSDYLQNNIDESNVCSVHEQAVFYEMNSLKEKCLSFIFENATSVLSSPDFLKLSHATLLNILKKDELAGDEIEIFQAAIRWAERNKKSKVGQNVRDQLGEAAFLIRFPIMPIQEFARVVTPSGILTNEELVLLYQYNATNGSTPVGKFIERERSGASVNVDTRQYIRGQDFVDIIKGCILEIQGCNYSFDPLSGFPLVSEQFKSKKTIKLKSITGTFVGVVKGINVGGTRTTDYKVRGNKITFKNPIDISNHFKIEFLSNNGNRAYRCNAYHTGIPNHVSYGINQQENIKGQTIIIQSLPDGLESITYV